MQFEADSFLRGMVRAIVGTLLKLNQKENSVAKLREILALRDRSIAGQSVPARGLCLMNVKY
jgi:tRNA pseudouridine38-40 synthase